MSSLLRNISWLTLGSALTKPAWLVFLVVVCVRELGEEGYGVFTATLALAAIARSLTDFGITPYSVREVARRRTHATRFLSNFLSVKVGLSVLALVAALAVGVALGYTGGKLTALIFAGCYMMAAGLVDYFRAFFQAFERMKDEALSAVLEKTLVIGCGLFFLWRYGTPTAVLGGMTLGMAATLLFVAGWATRRYATVRPALFSASFLKQALLAALPLGLAGQFATLYFRTDAVMVDAMVGEAAAGQYGEAYRLLEAVVLATGLVTTVIYPRLSSLFHEKRGAAFGRIFGLSLLGVGALGLGAAVVAYGFAGPLMRLLTGGTAFEPAARALQILAWAAPFVGLNYVLSVAMNAADDQHLLAWVLGFAALFNLVVNFILIPRYSFYGASAATVATEALITLALAVRYTWHTRLRLDAPA